MPFKSFGWLNNTTVLPVLSILCDLKLEVTHRDKTIYNSNQHAHTPRRKHPKNHHQHHHFRCNCVGGAEIVCIRPTFPRQLIETVKNTPQDLPSIRVQETTSIYPTDKQHCERKISQTDAKNIHKQTQSCL